MDEVRPKFKHQLIANLHQSSNHDNYLFNTFKILQSTALDDHKIKPFENITFGFKISWALGTQTRL